MPDFYVYLISSLPALHFGAKPPFSSEKFLGMCEKMIPDNEMDFLHSVAKGEAVKQPAFQKWQEFDVALRNELVKIRASRKHLDPAKYMHQDGFTEPSVSHVAINAHRNVSILEAERMLDQARWVFLDELSVGHYFDIDFLIIYMLKLLILERWSRINTANVASEVEALC